MTEVEAKALSDERIVVTLDGHRFEMSAEEGDDLIEAINQACREALWFPRPVP